MTKNIRWYWGYYRDDIMIISSIILSTISMLFFFVLLQLTNSSYVYREECTTANSLIIYEKVHFWIITLLISIMAASLFNGIIYFFLELQANIDACYPIRKKIADILGIGAIIVAFFSIDIIYHLISTNY